MDRLIPALHVKKWLKRRQLHAALSAERAETKQSGLFRGGGRAVHFDPVAGGEDHHLPEASIVAEVLQDLPELVRINGKQFPGGHGGRSMI
jgi:hypothetical protein